MSPSPLLRVFITPQLLLSGCYTFTMYGTVRCKECDQDITSKTQVYDWAKDRKSRVVYCEMCNWRLGKVK